MGRLRESRQVAHLRPRILAVAPLLVAVASAVACSEGAGGASDALPAGPSVTTFVVALPSTDVMLAEKVLGSAAAPVTMIEYSSLTCPHCASFHATTLPQIKTAYLDTGKVRLVYRDFPLDNNAIQAAMVARCSGDRFFAVLDRLYQTQSSWASSASVAAGLKSAVAPLGVTADEVDACLAMTDLRAGILAMKAAGQTQHAVSGTPTFIVGAQTLVGAWPFATFESLLPSLLP
jgi:protein-disulfide isomerase